MRGGQARVDLLSKLFPRSDAQFSLALPRYGASPYDFQIMAYLLLSVGQRLTNLEFL